MGTFSQRLIRALYGALSVRSQCLTLIIIFLLSLASSFSCLTAAIASDVYDKSWRLAYTPLTLPSK